MRVSTEAKDLTAQLDALQAFGEARKDIYGYKSLTATNRERPGLGMAMVAVRAGNASGVNKLDRLARLGRTAADIADDLTHREVALSLSGSTHDPKDPVEKLPFNALAMVAEFEADLNKMRTHEGGAAVAKAKGRLRGEKPN